MIVLADKEGKGYRAKKENGNWRAAGFVEGNPRRERTT